MKKMIFGCTLLIMGTLFSEYSLGVAIPFWIIGSVLALMGFATDNKGK